MPVAVKMTLRLPHQVHAALNRAAEDEGKSLNQLMVERLNASVGGAFITEDEANASNILDRLSKVEADVERIPVLEEQIARLTKRLAGSSRAG